MFHLDQVLLLDTITPDQDNISNLLKFNPDITTLKDNTLFLEFLQLYFSLYFLKQKDNDHKILYL